MVQQVCRLCLRPALALHACTASSAVSTFALCMQGAPYQALSVPNAMWSGVGLTDVLLTPKGPYSALASAQDGHVSPCNRCYNVCECVSLHIMLLCICALP